MTPSTSILREQDWHYMSVTGQVFISYKRVDLTFALRLYEDLRAKGFTVWIDKRDIHAGNWDEQVEQALKDSAVMLLIVTPESMISQNVKDEWNYFLEAEKQIVPVILRSPIEIPFRLRRRQWIDFTLDYTLELPKLVQELIHAGATSSANSEVTLRKPPSEPSFPVMTPALQTFTPSPNPPSVTPSNLYLMITQPTDLLAYSLYFPEISAFAYRFDQAVDTSAIAQSWQMSGQLTLANLIPSTLTRLGCRRTARRKACAGRWACFTN
jgi:TIR domain